MIQAIAIWLVAAAFFGAGLFNVIGTKKRRTISSDGVIRAGGTSLPAHWKY